MRHAGNSEVRGTCSVKDRKSNVESEAKNALPDVGLKQHLDHLTRENARAAEKLHSKRKESSKTTVKKYVVIIPVTPKSCIVSKVAQCCNEYVRRDGDRNFYCKQSFDLLGESLWDKADQEKVCNMALPTATASKKWKKGMRANNSSLCGVQIAGCMGCNPVV